MAILKYTALRLLLFLAVAGLLYLVGLRGFLLLALAFLLSGFVSLVVLSRTRDDVSAAITHRISEVNRRIDERAAAEDVPDVPPRPVVGRDESADRPADGSAEAADTGSAEDDHPRST